jgi:hypothetical protein
MSLSPVKPIANADAYEIMNLIKDSPHKWRVRKKYSPVIAKEISAALIQTGRLEIARELGIPLTSEEGMSITNEQGSQWYLFNAFYKDFQDLEVVLEPEIDRGSGDIKLDKNGKIIWKQKLDAEGKPILTPKIKSRPEIPTPVVKCALRTICDPIGDAPEAVSVFHDIDEIELEKVMLFFIICRLKPEEMLMKSPESMPPSEKNGAEDTSGSSEKSNTIQGKKRISRKGSPST